MKDRAIAIALGLTIVSVAPLSAQNLGDLLVPESDAEISRVGTRGANFLGIGVGARAMGMGGIGTTLGGGLSALYWNTASIVDVETVAIGVSSADLYGNSGLSHTFGGLVAAVGDGAVGLSVSYFTSGEVERTTEEYPDGNDPSFGAVVECRWRRRQVHRGGNRSRQGQVPRLRCGSLLRYRDLRPHARRCHH